MASTRGQTTGVFSVLPSLPTSGPFDLVKCFCLLVGWKMQCKMVLEMLRLPLSFNPYPKAAGPPASAFFIHSTSWDRLIYWSSLQSSSALPTAGEGTACCCGAWRPFQASPSPLPTQMGWCSLGQNKKQKGRLCRRLEAWGWRHRYGRSIGAHRFSSAGHCVHAVSALPCFFLTLCRQFPHRGMWRRTGTGQVLWADTAEWSEVRVHDTAES